MQTCCSLFISIIRVLCSNTECDLCGDHDPNAVVPHLPDEIDDVVTQVATLTRNIFVRFVKNHELAAKFCCGFAAARIQARFSKQAEYNLKDSVCIALANERIGQVGDDNATAHKELADISIIR